MTLQVPVGAYYCDKETNSSSRIFENEDVLWMKGL